MSGKRSTGTEGAVLKLVGFALTISLLILPLVCGQSGEAAQSLNETGSAQKSSSSQSANKASGATFKHYHITPPALAEPDTSGRVTNPPRLIPKPEGAELSVPLGFEVNLFVEQGLNRPRLMTLAPNGDVFVAESYDGRITIVRDNNGDGKSDEQFVFATGLMQPFGMAFWREYLYVGNTDAVVRFKYRPGQTKAEGEPEKIADLPGKGYREHWTRNVMFSPAGKMYVTVGSETNVNVESEPMRAAIIEYNPDGSGKRIYASGTRNPIGLAFNPQTRALWAAVQERDLLGDDLVPDYVTSIKEGAFYGWPYSYIGSNEDPRRKNERPDLVNKAIAPDVLIQAHSAVIGLVFYDGRMFPAEYRGDAFVALHGSWNRSRRTGYKVIRINFEKGKPVGGYDDFLTGWMLDENSKEVWGRPTGLLVLKDGSLLVADDAQTSNKIWRVSYRGNSSKKN